ncbi:hypothetical protein [Ferruginibacter albus]|uniref:hypothetical protein n=1 Tax=Ferruginibacter albus TaxID=2875540 RepID=UPI001CC439BC|nr:hypothetical protein [Ferruginibacter albus]UAY53184.1 hypothetical protein K9M53_05810 [Ferruginibacter albus]
MEKEMFYRHRFGRKNLLMGYLLTFFLMLSSYPRLLLEVFIRKDFGERYFKMISAITVAFILFAIPAKFAAKMYRHDGLSTALFHYGTWYLFIVYFLFVSYGHHQKIKRNPSVFDFAKFSVYSGTLNPKFYEPVLGSRQMKFNRRQVETIVEPALFFLIGIALWIMQQKLGILLVVSSIIYSLGYAAEYVAGDNYIMNMIDQKIFNQRLERNFVFDEEMTDCENFRGRKPSSENLRRQLLSSMMGEEEAILAK